MGEPRAGKRGDGMNRALELQNLSKRYGRKWALRDCTVKLPAGHVVALVGPNGAGKTTLLQLAAGLLKPSAGEVRVFGCDPHTQARETLPRIGFVAQDHPLYKHFKVADLLIMGRKMNPRWDQHIAEERLTMLDIPLKLRAGNLSGGQQAQVALALALAKRPDMMLLDEPLASMDPLARRNFLRVLMGETAEHGLTVLLSSHIIGDLERVCDYLIMCAVSAFVRLLHRSRRLRAIDLLGHPTDLTPKGKGAMSMSGKRGSLKGCRTVGPAS